jgi:acyl carrier protein
MDPETQRIFEVVKANVVKVLTGLDPALVTIERSLTELGANSVDRVEVVM